MLNCSSFHYFVSDIYGVPKLKEIDNIPDDVHNVESIGKFIAKHCGIGPLASYLFGFCKHVDDNLNNETKFLTYVNPSKLHPNDNDLQAEYRLAVLPGSIRKLSELSPNALNQLFLATKYNLMNNCLHLKDTNKLNVEKVLNNLLFYDLCKLIKHHLSHNFANEPEKEIVETLFCEKHLHIKLVEQYNKIKRIFYPVFFCSYY